jgi:hypothetical protein
MIMHSHRTLKVSDFTTSPGPRYVNQGEKSGEAYRALVAAALRENSEVTVDLDGTDGYGSSFIDEVFGGLVRDEGFAVSELEKKLTIKSDEDESYADEAWQSIREAGA